ncbi:bifunctional metallophosphatase/5'-nucleotidase [Streptomyces sp. SID5770]|uniref:bifunctional metallophosphatase/5'-nucleotidase n=1 Tax=Streptomyces sp. SID5770 TaxID=2690308 RepID=UPI001370EDD6|nr:bifunctional UDP-sugar hydrolase/5'-nucleotidase [Streptomyces sp. SID5770]MZE55591.1 bifunctional metallophosphatase/5'-nucleotidase [Streptomyces sp. SID5770]
MRNFLRRIGVIAAGTALLGGALSVSPAAADDTVDVQLLSITDFHGHLQPPTAAQGGSIPTGRGTSVTVGGAAYLATHLERLRSGHPRSVTFATGDSFAGWPFEVDAFQDEPTIEVLNKLGVRFSAMGNHELDVSPEFLVQHMQEGRCFGRIDVDSCFTDSTGRRFHGADFDFQSGNVVDARTGRPVVDPYRVEWFASAGGERIPVGFISTTVEGAVTNSTSFQPKLRALDQAETIARYTGELKRRGVEAIVLNVHEGGSPKDTANAGYDACDSVSGPVFELAKKVPAEIDAIVTGDWHWRFNCMVPDPAGVPRPIVEAGNHGAVINEINLSLDPRTGEVLRDRTRSVNHAVTRDVAPDRDVQRIVDYWVERGARRFAEPLARQTGSFTRTPNVAGESTAADLYADVQYWNANRTRAGRADLALISARPAKGSNAVRGDLPFAKGAHPADADGRILFGESWNAYGYGNPVLTVSVTGRQLDAVLEQQWQKQADGTVKSAPLAVSRNVSYSYDPALPVGDRVSPRDVVINGRPLDPARTYRVAALAYTVIGADGYGAFAGYTAPVRNGPDHESFVDYLKAHKTISPAPLDRVRIRVKS